MIKWVTPSLAVCNEDDMPLLATIDLAESAAWWIDQGGTSYVDTDETAAAVLDIIGLTADEIEDRLHFANTGRVLAK